MSERFTHLNERGEARVVDIGDKATTKRQAIAEGWLLMTPDTLARLRSATMPKGDALAVARIAGIMGAKRTSEIVPLCHPIALSHLSVDLTPDEAQTGIHCQVTAEVAERTGVEMEALCGVQCALLALYDMCKALDRGMTITNVRLLGKSGGRSGEWSRQAPS